MRYREYRARAPGFGAWSTASGRCARRRPPAPADFQRAMPDGRPELIFNLADGFERRRAAGIERAAGRDAGRSHDQGARGAADRPGRPRRASGSHPAAGRRCWGSRPGSCSTIPSRCRISAARGGRTCWSRWRRLSGDEHRDRPGGGQARGRAAARRPPGRPTAAGVRADRERRGPPGAGAGGAGRRQRAASHAALPGRRRHEPQAALRPSPDSRVSWPSWSARRRCAGRRVAQRHGYYDQAHLARDFRRFGGISPARYLSGVRELTRHFVDRDAPHA